MTTDRRTFLKFAAGSAAAAAANQAASATQQGPAKPLNLLLVFPDEMRAHAQGFMKEDPVLTPRIDKFAKEAAAMRLAEHEADMAIRYLKNKDGKLRDANKPFALVVST